MLRLMVAALVCVAFAGCAWLAGGQDPEVAAARTEADAALAEADDVKASHAAGEATDAEMAAVSDRLDTAEVRLRSAIETAGENVPNITGWGATIGGLLGPVGAAIGGLVGMLGTGVLAWRKARDLKAVLGSVQTSREELAEKNPEALKLVDAKLKAAIPAPLQDFIRKLKKNGILAELPK